MSGLTQEQRDAEEQSLLALAETLRELMTTTAAEGHAETIESCAAEAEKFAKMIREAVTPELAKAFAEKAATKATTWAELTTMLQFAMLVEGPDGEENHKAIQDAIVEEAEMKLRRTAEELRGLSATGGTDVFAAIGDIATRAEAGLVDFLSAETKEDKLTIFARVEEERYEWLQRMQTIQSSVRDGEESHAPTDGDSDNEEFHECEDPFEKAWAAMTNMGAFTGESNFGRGGKSAAKAAVAPAVPAMVHPVEASRVKPFPLTGDDSRDELVAYLTQGDNAFMTVLRTCVEEVKADSRFEGVREDVGKFLEQMEAAANAVLTPVPPTSACPAGTEDALQSALEPMRGAQQSCQDAKKTAFDVQKYDIYKRKGDMPKLQDEHADLLECAMVSVDLCNRLRKEARKAILDGVSGLAAQAA